MLSSDQEAQPDLRAWSQKKKKKKGIPQKLFPNKSILFLRTQMHVGCYINTMEKDIELCNLLYKHNKEKHLILCSQILTLQNHSPRNKTSLWIKMNPRALEREVWREIQHHKMSPPQGVDKRLTALLSKGNRCTVGDMRFLLFHFAQGTHKDPHILERAGMTEQRNDSTQVSTYKTTYTQFKNNLHSCKTV